MLLLCFLPILLHLIERCLAHHLGDTFLLALAELSEPFPNDLGHNNLLFFVFFADFDHFRRLSAAIYAYIPIYA